MELEFFNYKFEFHFEIFKIVKLSLMVQFEYKMSTKNSE